MEKQIKTKERTEKNGKRTKKRTGKNGKEQIKNDRRTKGLK